MDHTIDIDIVAVPRENADAVVVVRERLFHLYS